MVDVAHHRHHGRPRRKLALGVLHRRIEICVRIRQLGGGRLMPHLLDDDHRRLLIEHLVDRDHLAELHQHLDDLGRFHRHLVGEVGDGDRLRHVHIADEWLGRRSEHLGSVVGLAVAATSGRVPARTAAGIAARLDRPLLRALVPPDRNLLRRLLGLLLDCLRGLGLVQRRVRRGWLGRRCSRLRSRPRGLFGRAQLGLALFRGPPLALLLLGDLRRLQRGELGIATALLLAQLDLPPVDRRRRRARRLGRRHGRVARLALHEHALLAHLHLDGARLARRIGLLDLARLPARERDLGLGFSGAVRLPQVVEEPGLVLLGERVLGDRLVDARGAELLEQHLRRHFQLAGELRNAHVCHAAVLTPL